MDLTAFKASLTEPAPPPEMPRLLRALWHEARGDWTGAHDLLQNDNSAVGAWVHAYLHRKEGDVSNAAYWYRRAGKPVVRGGLETEWAAIATSLLGESASE